MTYTLAYKPFYRRRLPHFQPPGAVLFITFRLKDSLPRAVLDDLRDLRERTERSLERIEDPRKQARQADLE